MSRTMHNPAFAQRTWARLRALRPLDHMHPADREMRAIRTICGKLNIDSQHEVVAKFHCTLEELTLPNASAWIDELKKRAAQ